MENSEAILDPKLIARMSPRELGLFLRRMRKNQRKRQLDIAVLAGTDPAYISRLESGKKDIRRDPKRAEKILKAYGLPEEVVRKVVQSYQNQGRAELPRFTHLLTEHEFLPEEAIPLKAYHIPMVEAGAGLPTWDDVRETVLLFLPSMMKKDPQTLFAVRIIGDSMEPLLYEGDIAIVWTEDPPESGKIVAIGIPSNGIVVKRLYFDFKGTPIMNSINPKYSDEPLPEGAKIWGTVVGIVRELKSGRPGKHLLRP